MSYAFFILLICTDGDSIPGKFWKSLWHSRPLLPRALSQNSAKPRIIGFCYFVFVHSCSIRYFWESQNVSVCHLSLEAQLIRVSLFRHLNMPTSTKRKSDKDTSTSKTPANKPVFCLCWENEFKLQKCLSSEDAKLQFDLLSAVKATNCTIVSFAS